MDGERLTGATAIAVLGVALTALFLGFDWFWMVFVIGYAVVLPLVAILTGADEDDPVDDAVDEMIEDAFRDALGRSEDAGRSREDGPDSKADALDRLRDRYARGELDDEQFERKLARLLETETLEDAREYARSGGDREQASGRGDREPIREGE